MATIVKAPESTLQSLGRYQDLQRIAEGGMGTVFRARDPFSGNEVALKVLQPSIAENPVQLKRFRQEFKAASTLDHPHIVRALEFGQADGRYFIVLEYVDGISLGEGIERHGRLPEAEAVRLIGQVAAALHHAHEKGFLHRDVKPDNILVSSSGQAKLTDLGLVKVQDENLELTRAGKGLGTPYFMAPEQLADAKTVDRRADVYGLAATLYIAVTGELPFRSRGYLSVFKKKTASEITPPRELIPALSERLNRAVVRALSADPADRPDSCQKFMVELTGQDPAAERQQKARAVPKPSGAERRATIRYSSQSEGVCLPVGGGEEVRWSAQILDVSTGGVSLQVNRRFEPGTILALEFSGRKTDRPERLLVRVVRVHTPSRRKWVLGCAFGRGLGEEEVLSLT